MKWNFCKRPRIQISNEIELWAKRWHGKCRDDVFLYFIIAGESVAETSEHGIQTNGEQRALNVVGIGFKPWIFWKLLKVPQNLFSLRKKVSRSSRWINEKKKKNASSADECARDFIWRWYPLTSVVASKRFTGIANYSSRLTAIVNIEPVGNNLH